MVTEECGLRAHILPTLPRQRATPPMSPPRFSGRCEELQCDGALVTCNDIHCPKVTPKSGGSSRAVTSGQPGGNLVESRRDCERHVKVDSLTASGNWPICPAWCCQAAGQGSSHIRWWNPTRARR